MTVDTIEKCIPQIFGILRSAAIRIFILNILPKPVTQPGFIQRRIGPSKKTTSIKKIFNVYLNNHFLFLS